ncbi:MAG: NTP transferase domain-containing protein [Candidatus Wildermuthbacteria bacterium]|nr:NTP transferase domain-containing protein [Parcubacteria group bacterium]MBI2573825.1 NTP transferase domain-containing protein [Candidatus Wildermuthbacteria bacterium]
MKTIILCGGLGTRMKEETEFKPKPLVLVGGRPIVWHIMKIYSHHGFPEFVLALGYRGDMIKEYFFHSRIFLNDFTLNVANGNMQFHDGASNDFQITFSDTGLESDTGERILRCQKYITENEFMVTYGDGVTDLNIQDLVAFHRAQGKLGTITGVHPHSKYGLVEINKENSTVKHFDQKPLLYDYVSGGFMVFKKEAFQYFDEGKMENGLMKLAAINQLSIYRHEGFWKAMDTYREMEDMNRLWSESKPWAIWEKQRNHNE